MEWIVTAVLLIAAGTWAAHHPGLAVVAGIGLAALATGIIRACREFGPSLVTVARRPADPWCPSCGQEVPA